MLAWTPVVCATERAPSQLYASITGTFTVAQDGSASSSDHSDTSTFRWEHLPWQLVHQLQADWIPELEQIYIFFFFFFSFFFFLFSFFFSFSLSVS